MASQALYRKWRSQTFDEIIGQGHVTQTLINALKMDRVAHAYLFSGPRGTGKTSTARLLAKAVNCLAPNIDDRPCNTCDICTAVTEGRLMDLIEIDAASNTGVDDIRDLREKVGFRPAQAKIKFYIIDEVHMLSNSAFNALLKTLEEPPAHVIFVLATTEPEKIPATILSRCQRFDFKRIRLEDVAERLRFILAEEGFDAEDSALEYIARQGGGSMRDAISLLDQMIAYGGQSITLELVQRVLGAVTSQSVIDLVAALAQRDVAAGLDVINRVVGDGVDPRQFAREIVEYLRSVMLAKLAPQANLANLPDDTLATVRQQGSQLATPDVVFATGRFNAAMVDLKSGLLSIPQLPLELAFVEAAAGPVSAEPAAVAPLVVQSAPPRPAAEPMPPSAPPRQTPKPAIATQPPPAVPYTVHPPAPEGALTAAMVQSVFSQALEDLEEGRTKDGRRGTLIAKALRYDAQLLKVTGDEIIFSTSDLMKSKFEKAQPRANIIDVFSRLLGRPVNVKFLSEEEAAVMVAGTAPKASADVKKNDETDALVKMMTEELGGRIVD
ncbi:MAG: hypothetical protein FOGNACKC_02152 [Anaerolineae bacterium]|nr:hypothetical protein [Anaerolineae bacterium]